MTTQNEWADVLARYPRLEMLSDRQAEIVRLLAAGMTLSQVAETMGIEWATVLIYQVQIRIRLAYWAEVHIEDSM